MELVRGPSLYSPAPANNTMIELPNRPVLRGGGGTGGDVDRDQGDDVDEEFLSTMHSHPGIVPGSEYDVKIKPILLWERRVRLR